MWNCIFPKQPQSNLATAFVLAGWMMLGALAGCATTGTSPHPATPPHHDQVAQNGYRLALLQTANCCRGENARTLRKLESEIQRSPNLILAGISQASAAPAEESKINISNSQRVRGLMASARQEYLKMDMTRAQELLEQAQKIVDQQNARELLPKDLALLHFLLGSVKLALSDVAGARRHYVISNSLEPRLEIDKDLFSPTIREEWTKAQTQNQDIEISISSQPANAQVFIDGAILGRTPLKATVRTGSEHYVRVEVPFYATYEKKIDFQPGNELALQLTPLPEEKLLNDAAAHQEAAAHLFDLLQIDRLIWLVESQDSLRLDLMYREEPQKLHSIQLSRAPSVFELQQLTRRLENQSETPSAANTISSNSDVAQTFAATPTQNNDQSRPGFFRRTAWVWAGVGVALVTAAIVLPILLANDDDNNATNPPNPPDTSRGAVVTW